MNRCRRLLAPLCIILFGVLAWHGALDGAFVYDDEAIVVKNESIRSLTPASKFLDPSAISSDPRMQKSLWRPVTAFAYAALYAAGSGAPQPFHAAGIGLHILNALLVLWLITALFRSRTAGLITALVFLLHPAQVESVAWISALANPLFLTTYLLAALLFLLAIDTETKAYYPLSAFCFVLSLLSKEMAVTLPMLMAVIVMLRRRDGQKATYLSVLPYLAGGVGFAVLRSAVLGQTAQTGYWAGSLYAQALTMLKGFAQYVKLALAPYPLSLEYLWPAKQGLDAETALYALLLSGLLVLGFKLLRRAPKAGVGILLFAGALAPVSNLIPLTTIINERFLYLSLIGWGLIVSEILEHSG
ncbi:MAG: glycosyltransferase family 39 protein, partial [Elusimicrobiota bacterium]